MSEQSEIIFQRLVREMKTEETVRSVMDLLLVEDSKNSGMERVTEKIREVILSDQVMKKFLDEMVNILGTHFSPEEAQEILNWNMSPTGKKYTALCPIIATEFQGRLLKFVKPLFDKKLDELDDTD